MHEMREMTSKRRMLWSGMSQIEFKFSEKINRLILNSIISEINY